MSETISQIQINPSLNINAHQATLKQNGRVQIPDFFTPESASYLYKLLKENRHWNLAYNRNNQFFESPMSEFQNLTPAQKQDFMSHIFQGGQRGFQYIFLQYYITQAIELGENPEHPMHIMHDFVNDFSFLELMRALTSEPSIKKADSYASCYSPGHFLTQHDDTHQTHDRVAAYVFSMTENWNTNWGGHLAFFDKSGNIEQSFIPSFNCLNIFMIPQAHAVQQVTPFAGHSRTSYLGWLHR